MHADVPRIRSVYSFFFISFGFLVCGGNGEAQPTDERLNSRKRVRVRKSLTNKGKW